MVEGQEDVTWEQWLALARTCEETGIEALFRSDHYTSVFGALERGSLDAWASLAGIAAGTSRLRLGTMVSPATFRHPSELARVAATVDHISGGRVELGLGAGWYELEHRAHGFDFPDLQVRIERFVEQLEIVHRQWTEEAFSYDGMHYRLEDCRALPKPLQKPRPPIIVGGSGGRGTVEPAVRIADEYNTPLASPEQCRARRQRVVEACERAGRDPASLPFSLMTTTIVGADRAEVLARTRAVMRTWRSDGDPEAFLEERAGGWIVGTVDEVVERLREYAAAGVERVMLQHLVPEDLEMVAMLGRDVGPRAAKG